MIRSGAIIEEQRHAVRTERDGPAGQDVVAKRWTERVGSRVWSAELPVRLSLVPANAAWRMCLGAAAVRGGSTPLRDGILDGDGGQHGVVDGTDVRATTSSRAFTMILVRFTPRQRPRLERWSTRSLQLGRGAPTHRGDPTTALFTPSERARFPVENMAHTASSQRRTVSPSETNRPQRVQDLKHVVHTHRGFPPAGRSVVKQRRRLMAMVHAGPYSAAKLLPWVVTYHSGAGAGPFPGPGDCSWRPDAAPHS